MSELFVELFSEEIPARLQINARNELKKNIQNFFVENQINIVLDASLNLNETRRSFLGGFPFNYLFRIISCFSLPSRLIFYE